MKPASPHESPCHESSSCFHRTKIQPAVLLLILQAEHFFGSGIRLANRNNRLNQPWLRRVKEHQPQSSSHNIFFARVKKSTCVCTTTQSPPHKARLFPLSWTSLLLPVFYQHGVLPFKTKKIELHASKAYTAFQAERVDNLPAQRNVLQQGVVVPNLAVEWSAAPASTTTAVIITCLPTPPPLK